MICTECGKSFKNKTNLTLPIISIVLSAIGIIGFWILYYSIRNPITVENSIITIYQIFHGISMALLFAGILVAIIAQYNQRSIIVFIVGIIPCAYLIILSVFQNIAPLLKY